MTEQKTLLDLQILTLIQTYKLRFTPTDIKQMLIDKYEADNALIFNNDYRNNKVLCNIVKYHLEQNIMSKSLKHMESSELEYEVEKYASYLSAKEWDNYILLAILFTIK